MLAKKKGKRRSQRIRTRQDDIVSTSGEKSDTHNNNNQIRRRQQPRSRAKPVDGGVILRSAGAEQGNKVQNRAPRNRQIRTRIEAQFDSNQTSRLPQDRVVSLHPEKGGFNVFAGTLGVSSRNGSGQRSSTPSAVSRGQNQSEMALSNSSSNELVKNLEDHGKLVPTHFCKEAMKTNSNKNGCGLGGGNEAAEQKRDGSDKPRRRPAALTPPDFFQKETKFPKSQVQLLCEDIDCGVGLAFLSDLEGNRDSKEKYLNRPGITRYIPPAKKGRKSVTKGEKSNENFQYSSRVNYSGMNIGLGRHTNSTAAAAAQDLASLILWGSEECKFMHVLPHSDAWKALNAAGVEGVQFGESVEPFKGQMTEISRFQFKQNVEDALCSIGGQDDLMANILTNLDPKSAKEAIDADASSKSKRLNSKKAKIGERRKFEPSRPHGNRDYSRLSHLSFGADYGHFAVDDDGDFYWKADDAIQKDRKDTKKQPNGFSKVPENGKHSNNSTRQSKNYSNEIIHSTLGFEITGEQPISFDITGHKEKATIYGEPDKLNSSSESETTQRYRMLVQKALSDFTRQSKVSGNSSKEERFFDGIDTNTPANPVGLDNVESSERLSTFVGHDSAEKKTKQNRKRKTFGSDSSLSSGSGVNDFEEKKSLRGDVRYYFPSRKSNETFGLDANGKTRKKIEGRGDPDEDNFGIETEYGSLQLESSHNHKSKTNSGFRQNRR